MNIMKVLHSYWVGQRHDSQTVKNSWKKVDREINQYLPGEKQDDFFSLINDHCYRVEYQGFLAGFRMATKIWRKMK